jgi:hypothetical protein
MFMLFHALRIENAFIICYSAPALSAIIWVRSCIKQATIPASSALSIVLLMILHSRFVAVALYN